MRTLILLVVILCSAGPVLAQPVSFPKPVVVPASGMRIVVNQSTQTLRYFIDGKFIEESPCGTGAAYSKENTTPNGSFAIDFKQEHGYVSKKYDVPMPYAMRMAKTDGCFIHAGLTFVQFNGKGIPQSGGCIRLPTEFAKKLFSITPKGTVVEIVGDYNDALKQLPIDELFEKVNGQYRMKILSPKATADDVKIARKLFFEKKLFIEQPDQTKDRTKCYVRYPNMPESARVPLLQFESLILTKDEKSRGLKIMLD